MARTLDMFGKLPRKKPRVIMHFTDVGMGLGGETIATFQCPQCGHKTEWLICDTNTDVKRGEPCPVCNEESGA